jgi:sulfite reductase (NADPH) flavoprotein alpha-component
MVGPGTGIAPFRAFMQEREAIGAEGKNWLFFGEQHFITDFLYQIEWQKYLKDGLLTCMDVAFSRDQAQKIYVQHRMLEKKKDLYAWLEAGAYFYVCGDVSKMAKDVENALLQIIRDESGKNEDFAKEYIANLRAEKRYRRDVY